MSSALQVLMNSVWHSSWTFCQPRPRLLPNTRQERGDQSVAYSLDPYPVGPGPKQRWASAAVLGAPCPERVTSWALWGGLQLAKCNFLECVAARLNQL